MAIISRPPPWRWLSSQCCSQCRWAGSRPPCPASLSASTWRCKHKDFGLSHLLKGERYWCELSGQTEKAGVFSEKVSHVPANFFFSWNPVAEIFFVDFPQWLQQSFASTTTFALFALEKWPEQEKHCQLFICCSHHPPHPHTFFPFRAN